MYWVLLTSLAVNSIVFSVGKMLQLGRCLSEWSLSLMFSAVCLYMRKLHCIIYGNDSYILVVTQKLSGHGPEQLILGGPA